MAYGKVIIGFSAPFVGVYNNNGGTVTYTNGQRLARGVSVSLNTETADNNDFYADGIVAETEGGKFKSGTAKYTVDGLHDVAERLIYGIPEPEDVQIGENMTVKVTKYGDNAEPPYVGTGFIVWYQSEGVVTYQPMILPKVKFITHGTEAKSKNEQKGWQTQDLEATICRDDTENHDWKWLLEEQSTEEQAIAILEALLGVANETSAANEKSNDDTEAANG